MVQQAASHHRERRQGRWCGPWLLLALGLCTWAGLPVAAALPLQVLARTSLALQVEGDSFRLQISGRLLDDLGQGVVGQEVLLRVGVEQRRVISGVEGILPPWILRLPPGDLTITAEFAGDLGGRGYQGNRVTLSQTVERPQPRLRIEVAPEVRGPQDLPLEVAAELHGAPLSDLAVTLTLDGRHEGTRTTSGSGRARWRLSAGRLGGPGPHLLEVRSADTRLGEPLKAAVARVRVVRQVATDLEVQARLQEGLLEDQVELTGRLSAEQAGLPGRDLRLEIGLTGDRRQRVVGTAATTDEEGRYRISLPVAEVEPGPARFLVEFLGDVGLDPVREEAALTIPRPRPPALWPRVAVAAGSGLLVLLALLRGPFRRLLGRWRRPRSTISSSPAEHPTRTPLPAFSLLPPPSEQATAGELTVHGVLWDRLEDQPVVGGLVSLELAGRADAPAAVTGPDGRFTLTASGPGRWLLRGTAPGYVSATESLTLPSRFFRNSVVRFGLLPVREAVRQVWLAEVRRLHDPRRMLWGWLTPAQLLTALGEQPRLAASRLSELTALLERVWYGPGPHVEEEHRQARMLAASDGSARGSGASRTVVEQGGP